MSEEKKTTKTKKVAAKTTKKAVKKAAPKKAEPIKEVLPTSEEQADLDALLNAGEIKEETEADKTQKALDEISDSDPAKEIKDSTSGENRAPDQYQSNVFLPLSAPTFEGDTCEEAVEEKRKLFYTAIKKSRRFSTIIMLVIIVGLVGGFILNTYLPSDLKWVVYTVFGVLAALVIVSFVISSRIKKGMYGDIDVYVKDAFSIVDSYVFADPEFIDPEVSRTGHIDVADIGNAHYFDTIDSVNSRNIVSVKFMGKKMIISEVAAKVPAQPEPTSATEEVKEAASEPESKFAQKKPQQKQQAYGIFGKFICYPLALKENAGLIIVLKGVNNVLPSYLDGYSEITISSLNENYLVYTDNAAICNKVFEDKEFTDILNSIQSDENLENFFFCINPKGLRACLNYNETVMEVPMEKGVKGKPYLHYKGDIQKVKSLIKALSK